MTNRYPITNDPLEYDNYSKSGMKKSDTSQLTIIGKAGTGSQDIQLRVCGAAPSYAGTIEIWNGDPNATGSVKVATITAGATAFIIMNENTSVSGGSISINQSTGFIGINKSDPQTALDVYGEVLTLGDASTHARFRLRGIFASTPSDPPSGCGDIFIFDNNVNPPELQIRYNDGGTMRKGTVTLGVE